VKVDGINSLCFPLSFFCGENGLWLARGAVVSTKREAESRSFEGRLEVEDSCLGGVAGKPLGSEIEPEWMVATLDSFL